LHAAIDIHKLRLQAAVLDPDSGEVCEERFAGTREGLNDWAMRWGTSSSRLIATIEDELATVETELRRFARADRRCQALETIDGVGPILACHILAEPGDARHFHRARQAVGVGGLDPVVDESGETPRRGHPAKHGSPELRWALVQAGHQARRHTSPQRDPMLGELCRQSGLAEPPAVCATYGNRPNLSCANRLILRDRASFRQYSSPGRPHKRNEGS
jgi:hypothetical protein